MPARRSKAPRTLHLLMALHDETDITLGAKLGLSRQSVHSKRTGRTAITADDMQAIAAALDVDPVLLLGEPHQAVAWMVAHKPELLDDVLSNHFEAKSCTAPKLNRSLLSAKLLARTLPGGIRAAA